MSASSRSRRGGSQRRRISWWRLAVVWFTVSVLLASVSCTSRLDDKVENPTVISYAGAASRLNGLEPAEVQEQLRDWARTALASYLELDTAQFRDAVYDTLPVRDLAFADLSRQSTGPGRALFDGRDVLHVLVARDDPHAARTIGLLLDQHRSDAGADPQQVQVHRYEIGSGTQTIGLIHEKPAPTSEVRSANGFVTMRVDETKGLTDFLAQTRHLSWLEVRGSEIWAGGWNWPGVPAAPLDFEDVSVLQRGYLQPASESRPGFSLDPGPLQTRDDVVAVLPGLRPDLVDRLITDDWKGSLFNSADQLAEVVDDALFFDNPQPAVLTEVGLPSDRTQLWVLSRLLGSRPAYSQARYDGSLEGTKVGMTLFYTDYVAKNWVHGVGTGVPINAVGGFIPNSDAVIPWSHCADAQGSQDESGRLWFGQNDSGFAFDGDRVSIAAQATRLFARSDSEGGTEVEQSFGFGWGKRWWDQHYQAVADYEPQYQRLDQIMRWSGALEWLTSTKEVTLPQLDDAAIQSDLQFKDWYAQHGELRERSDIEFVAPPSATQEAILAKPSEVYENCGSSWISGGVSLGDVIQRKAGRSFQADLPMPVRRGGLFDETSRIDPATGAGQIKQVSIDGSGNVVGSLQRTFSMRADGHAIIDVVADGRRVVPFGGLKVWRAETAPRQLGVDVAAGRGQVSQRVELQGHELGELMARKGGDTITVQWRQGWFDRARRGLESIQDRLRSQPAAEPPAATDGVLASVQDASGQVRYKIGGPHDPWLSITKERTPPGEEMVLRTGGPHPETGRAEFFEGRFTQRPELPPVDGGPPRWIEITPGAGGQPPRMIAAALPDPNAATVKVTTPDGATATAVQIGDRAVARADDPILGINGTVEGTALLRDFPRVAEAMRTGAEHGLHHGVRFGDDGVALARGNEVILAAADHPWAGRMQQVIGPDSAPQAAFRIEGRLLHVDVSELTVRPGSVQRSGLGELLDTTSGDMYLHRSMLTIEDGAIVRGALPREENVIVSVAERPSAEGMVSRPDIRIHDGAEWWRVSGTAPGSGVPVPSGQVVLVCPENDENTPACEQ
ncbi:MAG: hypothetical protein ACRDTH_13150 [Pseudonocardiaceae bacterium]